MFKKHYTFYTEKCIHAIQASSNYCFLSLQSMHGVQRRISERGGSHELEVKI